MSSDLLTTACDPFTSTACDSRRRRGHPPKFASTVGVCDWTRVGGELTTRTKCPRRRHSSGDITSIPTVYRCIHSASRERRRRRRRLCVCVCVVAHIRVTNVASVATRLHTTDAIDRSISFRFNVPLDTRFGDALVPASQSLCHYTQDRRDKRTNYITAGRAGGRHVQCHECRI